jgi:copper chaperone CopZ
MEQLTIQASKIKCGGCAGNIKKGLDGFAGVTEVNVDIATNIVSIQGNDLDKTAIENKLTELGYPAI